MVHFINLDRKNTMTFIEVTLYQRSLDEKNCLLKMIFTGFAPGSILNVILELSFIEKFRN